VTKGIIFNADDFGRSGDENLAIVKTLSQGVVRSATVMANMPAAGAIHKVHGDLPDVGVGVHLNLTEGRPVLSPNLAPSLVNASGTFWSKKQLFWRSCLGLIRQAEIVAELRAQILRVMEWVVEVTHVDSHQNIIIFPFILPAALEVLDSLGIIRIRTQNSYLIARSLRKGISRNLRPTIGLDGLLRPAWCVIKEYRGKEVERRWFRSTDSLLLGAPGYKDKYLSAEQILPWWEQVLPCLPDAILEVPTHPGFSPAEVAVLTDPRMTRLLEAFNVQVFSFAKI
jgi:hypothetical protein